MFRIVLAHYSSCCFPVERMINRSYCNFNKTVLKQEFVTRNCPSFPLRFYTKIILILKSVGYVRMLFSCIYGTQFNINFSAPGNDCFEDKGEK